MATVTPLPAIPENPALDGDFPPALTDCWARGLLQDAESPALRIATARRHGFPAVASAMEGLAGVTAESVRLILATGS